ncbi:MAG TPA: hypothetical protein VFR86_23955 [Burkholderiaceae bacterium]|nr:hypothetical protein [Burkholderiaceae bacterium]
MKLTFMLLVLANLVVFAWQQGVFGDLPEAGREPGRVARQIEPERIRVLEPREVAALKERAKEQKARDAAGKTAAPAATAEVTAAACVEFGDFAGEAAARARKRLDALNIANRLAELSVELPGWYMVFIPPKPTRAAVEVRAEELRRAGVKELLVIADNSPMRFGISLGSFRDQEVALKHLEDLRSRGIKDARMTDKPSTVAATRFQIKDVDADLARQLTAVHREFPGWRMQGCAGDR